MNLREKEILHSHAANPDQLEVMIERRSKNEPIAYIVGTQPFWDLEFFVDSNVLIPRPETEILVEKAIELIKKQGLRLVADIGTGSGCIAITLAKHLPQIKVIAIESSPKALEVAKKNAKKYGVEKQIEFIQGNFLEPIKGRQVDLIVSNPPYIPSKDLETLMPDVRDFEPHQALDGGSDGLDFIRKLLKANTKHLIFEFCFGQSPAIRKLCPDVKIIKDYSGIDRIAIIKPK